jgi:hypothetical protein
MFHKETQSLNDGALAPHSGQPWSRSDLFFLKDVLRRGLSPADVARFLGRTEAEVVEKATE